MHRILIVDEDEHLLWALEKNLFPERDDLQVVTATDGEEGMEILKGGDIDLLVSDIKMPGKVDGFQLILRAKEIAPDARVVIMTAFGSGRIESFADRMGITHYIEKPFNISELRDMALDLLDEKEGFQGMLSDLELTDIIQMLCLAKRTTLLHLKHKDHRGKIVFDRGDLVHAEFDTEEGAEAVYRMLALRQGDIFMESDVDYDERTIHVGWQDLLLEAVKRADEQRLAEASQGEDDGGSDGTPFSSFRPSESAEIDLKEVSDEAEKQSAADTTGEDDTTDRLTGDSFFTEEELEEIGMASSEAIENSFSAESSAVSDDEADEADAEDEREADTDDADDEHEAVGLSESSASDADVDEDPAGQPALEESSVSEVEVEEESAPQPEDDQLAADGGSPLGDESSGPEALDEGALASVTGVLEDFVEECSGLRITGLSGPGEDAAANFVEAARAGSHDPAAISGRMLEVVDRARRVAAALEADADANEIQLTLADAYVVVRRVGPSAHYHFAVVDRDASLGVVLVLMRQFAERLDQALAARAN